MYTVLREWPRILRNPHEVLSLTPNPYLSLDLEWNIKTNTPTILGVSDGIITVSCDWGPGKWYLQQLLDKHPQADMLGHYVIGADLPVLRAEGINIPLERVQDTILWHWLGNMNLAKGTKKDDEEGERRGRGWMNLFAACSMHLAVPNWKECVGEYQCQQEHRPCPIHTPYDYNGCDCYWPVRAFPEMVKRAKLMGTDRLYPLHRDLTDVLASMRAKGVLVNKTYVEDLRVQFAEDCKRIKDELPFNPDSPKQVREYFKVRGIDLENAQQETIDEACEKYNNEELTKLQEYGRLGNGPDRWFAPLEWDEKNREWKGYVDSAGYIHANLSPFTSTGRLACSSPNLQNLSHRPRKFEKDPKNTLAARIRRAVIAPEGYYLYEADYSNAENRVMLHLAGHTVPEGVDLHFWVAEIAEFKPNDPFCIKEGSPRQAAKTVQHGNFYGEGLSLITREEYRSNRIQAECARGVRVVYPDWTFNGKIVSFTGINFAQRAFGSATWENRKRANDIIGKLFSRFPGVRTLQQQKSKEIERDRCIRNEFGYCLPLYGYDPEKIKIGLAMTGSNPVAHATKLALINFKGNPYVTPVLQVHDSFLFLADRKYEPKFIASKVREVMEQPLVEMRNLTIPVDVKVSIPREGQVTSNWTDMEKVK